MSEYPPPREIVPIFNPLDFISPDTSITIEYANKNYLKFPVAQGTETLQEIFVNGDATFNNDIDINGNSALTLNGNSNIQQTSSNIPNNLNETLITTDMGLSSTASLQVGDSVADQFIAFLPNSQSYNPATTAGNEVILAIGNAINTETLELTTWSSTNSAVIVAPTSVSIGAGGTTSTPTSSVVCNGTSVAVAPSLTFPDGKVQNSAFTGAGALTGSYTNTNMTIDANGKITALANGSAGTTPFVPIFRNMCQVSTSNYIGGTRIQFNGSWGIQDYAVFRITAQANWGNNAGAWTNYSTTAGLIIARPFYMNNSSWAGTLGAGSGSIAVYPSNSGGVNAFGATQRPAYYTAIQNNGTTNFFYLYSNSPYQFQLMCNNANGLNVFTAWEYSHSIEYITRSVGGGSVQLSSVDGTNNFL